MDKDLITSDDKMGKINIEIANLLNGEKDKKRYTIGSHGSILIQAQLVETAILSIINGAMEHATGARRIIEATPNNVKVMEFGARRADGLEAAIDSSMYGSPGRSRHPLP